MPLVAGLLATPGLVNAAAYDRMAWDSCASGGPGSSGFLPFGVGCEADSIYNTVDGKMYLQRTACGNSGALLVSSDQTKARSAGQTLYSTAAAVLVEIVGSATKTVRVKKIVVWGQCATKFFTELELLRSTSVSDRARLM